ncbi:MAG: response regulator transcription factor [Anaerolineae bacterium]|nr:response regulator transcription factor [Anaerolineae bacterium]
MADFKILIVAENPLARMGLAALLAGQPGLNIAGQVSGASLLDDLDLYNPDVLVWDWGWGTPPELPRHLPVITLLKETAQASEAWNAGARGLLLGNTDADSLSAAVTTAAHGLAVLEPSLAGVLLPSGAESTEPPVDPLTQREMEVLQLLAEGLPNKLIAQRLSITDHTVKFHVNAIMGKLGVQSRTEAVVRATKLGLIIL